MGESKFFISETPAVKKPLKKNEETGNPELFINETTEGEEDFGREPVKINPETGKPELFIDEEEVEKKE